MKKKKLKSKIHRTQSSRCNPIQAKTPMHRKWKRMSLKFKKLPWIRSKDHSSSRTRIVNNSNRTQLVNNSNRTQLVNSSDRSSKDRITRVLRSKLRCFPRKFLTPVPSEISFSTSARSNLFAYRISKCLRYCPPPRDMTTDFARKVLSGKKSLLKLSEILWVD